MNLQTPQTPVFKVPLPRILLEQRAFQSDSWVSPYTAGKSVFYPVFDSSS